MPSATPKSNAPLGAFCSTSFPKKSSVLTLTGEPPPRLELQKDPKSQPKAGAVPKVTGASVTRLSLQVRFRQRDSNNLSSNDSDQAKQSERTGAPARIEDGVVKEAFDEDEMDTPDEKKTRPHYQIHPPFQGSPWGGFRQWRRSMFLRMTTPLTRHAKMELVMDTVTTSAATICLSPPSVKNSSRPRRQFWVTSSFEFFAYDIDNSPSAHRQHNITLVSEAGWLSVCGKNFNIAIFSDIINDTGQTPHDGSSTHWALPIDTTFSDLDCISKSQQCQTGLTENSIFSSDYVGRLYDCLFHQVDHEYTTIFYSCTCSR